MRAAEPGHYTSVRLMHVTSKSSCAFFFRRIETRAVAQSSGFWLSSHFTLHYCMMVDEDRGSTMHAVHGPCRIGLHGLSALFPKTYTWSNTNRPPAGLLPCRCSAGRGSWPTYSLKNLVSSSERSEIIVPADGVHFVADASISRDVRISGSASTQQTQGAAC